MKKSLALFLFGAIVSLYTTLSARSVYEFTINTLEPADFTAKQDFGRSDSDITELYNLVVFIRFADDEEITHPFNEIDSMFNGRTEGYLSIYNYYKVSTYDKIHYNTVYTDQIQNGQICSYVDIHPRGYFQPYSADNPLGYQDEVPFMGVHRREAELLGRVLHYVDSMGLVDPQTPLDGNHDGVIDNVSFIIKGGTGGWASILWPHMEFFPHDSLDYTVTVNGVRPNTFNFEFEGASSSLFSAHVFRHEMGHSLGLPDLYHYINYLDVDPAGSWDMMCNNYGSNQTNVMYKYKYLHVADEPIQITEDGTYTLLSNASSPTQNCYYIKSAIDSTQWFTFEYRNQEDLFDEDIPGTGMIIGRWNDTVPLTYEGMFANAFFDYHNQAHQYWIFRPGSSSDIMDGNIFNAHFSAATGRTSFGPNTNPHPYLTDGTPETSFEITDIQEFGDHLTFTVRFLNTGIDEHDRSNLTVYPNPATDLIHVMGAAIQNVELYNAMGQLVLTEENPSTDRCTISISSLPAGIYVMYVTQSDGGVCVKKVVKR